MFHQGVTQICRPEMDALKQPFDHDAVVRLCEIIVRRDDVQSARAIFIGVEINLLSEKRDVHRRDITADQPCGERALMPGGQPILAGKRHRRQRTLKIEVDEQHTFVPILGEIRADISRESCLADAAFEICYRERSRVRDVAPIITRPVYRSGEPYPLPSRAPWWSITRPTA